MKNKGGVLCEVMVWVKLQMSAHCLATLLANSQIPISNLHWHLLIGNLVSRAQQVKARILAPGTLLSGESFGF